MTTCSPTARAPSPDACPFGPGPVRTAVAVLVSTVAAVPFGAVTVSTPPDIAVMLPWTTGGPGF